MKSARLALFCLLAGTVLLASLPGAVAPTPVPTVIESDGPGEMTSTDTETTFTFRDKVVVTGTNLKLTCDLLVVVAKRSGDTKATFGKQENFKSLIATGNVRLVQAGREALCGKAEVFPDEDRVILSESPVVRMIDGSYEARGPIMELLRGEQRAIIRGTPQERTRILLPEIKDLGYDDKQAKKDAPAQPAPAPASEQAPTITLPKIETK